MRRSSVIMLAAMFVLGAGALATLRADDPPKTGNSISGNIVDKDSKPASNVMITVLLKAPDHSHDPKEVKTATSNDDGTFKIEGLETGRYILKYAKANQQAVSSDVPVQAGKDTPLGKITLRVVTVPRPGR